MSKLMIAMFVTAGLGSAGAGAAQMNSPMTAPMSKANYTQAVKDADAQYKIDKDACSSLSGNAKDICVAEAKGKKEAASAAAPAGPAVFPSAVDSKYSKESAGRARMHTCVDQYNANKATNANGGLKWIQKGGGYYSECTKKLKG